MPPTVVPVRVRNLVTGHRRGLEVLDVAAGGGDPDHGRPLQHPRRPARVPRDAATVAPLGRVVAYASATRSATSGERSTFAIPATPSRAEQAPRSSGLPDDRGVHDGASLDDLVRVHLHAGADDGLAPDPRALAEDDAVLEMHALADVARPRDDTAAGAHRRGEVDVVVDHAPLDHRVVAHAHVRPEHAVAVQLDVLARCGSCHR